MIEILVTIASAALCIWLIVSPFLFAYIVMNEGKRETVPKLGKDGFPKTGTSPGDLILFLSMMVSIIWIVSQGVQSLLLFIPEHWGNYDELGEYITARKAISYTIGFWAWGGYLYILGNFGISKAQTEPVAGIATQENRDIAPMETTHTTKGKPRRYFIDENDLKDHDKTD